MTNHHKEFSAELVAWAQEAERHCDKPLPGYVEINQFSPVRYFPGAISGHGLLPSIEILKTVMKSRVLEVVEYSNKLKAREARFRAANAAPSS